MSEITDPLEALQKFWGYDSFRSSQLEIIESVMAGNDTLALLPTGGGKSICFQIPALCKPGVCIVISPLIALMKDQVFNLQKRGISAAAIFSGMHYRDIDRVFDNVVYGNIKLLYLSPERLKTELAIERLKKMHVNLLAVDEAHCISQWGYDFRPPYLEIAEIRDYFPSVPVLALTATATQEVVIDIQERLSFRKENVIQKSFERSNLAYVVLNEENKLQRLVTILKKVRGPSVVYTRSRNKAKSISDFLLKNRIPSDFYHAGLSNDIRNQKQEDWLGDKSRVIVATNAFGMGIDKPDVRSVVHMDLPDSLEAYFQEAGRAGRDGKKSYAVLLYNEADRLKLESQNKLAFPPLEQVRRVYQALGSYFQLAIGGGQGESFDFDLIEFSKKFDLQPLESYHALKILEQSGWLVMTDAVYVPSSLKVLVSKDELYDFQLRNKKMDRLIKTILRTYQGAFNNYVNIHERQLCKFLKLPQDVLAAQLHTLERSAIISFKPQKDTPQIVFVHERVAGENLTIEKDVYLFRKKRAEYRVVKVIEYASELQCRSNFLLEYFGEEKDQTCGVCDVCLESHNSELSKEEFENFKSKVFKLLEKEDLGLHELVDSFSPKRRNKVLKTIEHLLDEGLLLEVEDKLSIPK